MWWLTYYGDAGSSDGDGVDDNKTKMIVLIEIMMVCESVKNCESSNELMDGRMNEWVDEWMICCMRVDFCAKDGWKLLYICCCISLVLSLCINQYMYM